MWLHQMITFHTASLQVGYNIWLHQAVTFPTDNLQVGYNIWLYQAVTFPTANLEVGYNIWLHQAVTFPTNLQVRYKIWWHQAVTFPTTYTQVEWCCSAHLSSQQNTRVDSFASNLTISLSQSSLLTHPLQLNHVPYSQYYQDLAITTYYKAAYS